MGVVEPPLRPQRKIVHVDMDAFFAAVEQRDHPGYRGKPVIVGGSPQSRGVVSTCSYEARAFGIHSAMPTARAYRLCPQGIFVEPRFEAYKAVSLQIREIFNAYTDLVEPLSLDEAYLDVTEPKIRFETAKALAEDIRRRIREETGLTASAGVADTKFLAKVASGFRKPDGLTVIHPDRAAAFIDALPIGAFHGIGAATEERMRFLGIETGADLKRWELVDLVKQFGKAGAYYHKIAHNRDDREVKVDRVRKSVGAEATYAEDLRGSEALATALRDVALRVERRLARAETAGRTITLKVRYADFETATRSITLAHDTAAADELARTAIALLPTTEAELRPVRLLGITVSNLKASDSESGVQLDLPL